MQKNGFAVLWILLGVIISLLVVSGVVIYVLKTHGLFVGNFGYVYPKYSDSMVPAKVANLKEGEYLFTPEQQSNYESYYFPSGSSLEYNGLHYDRDVYIDYEKDVAPFHGYLKVIHKGYIYEIKRENCYEGKSYLDIDIYRRTEYCDLRIKVSMAPAFEFPSYNGLSKNFSSIQKKEDSFGSSALIKNLEREPFYAILPPYFEQYEILSVGGNYFNKSYADVLVITAFGHKQFKFNTSEDVSNHKSLTEQIGPLEVTLSVTDLSCYPEIMDAEGKCTKTSTLPPYYNKLSYSISFVQKEAQANQIRILDLDYYDSVLNPKTSIISP